MYIAALRKRCLCSICIYACEKLKTLFGEVEIAGVQLLKELDENDKCLSGKKKGTGKAATHRDNTKTAQ